MVSLNDRTEVQKELLENVKTKAFIQFLSREVWAEDTPTTVHVDQLFYTGIVAFQSDKKELFLSKYNEFAQREPNDDRPYVNDDFLIFVLVCCVNKFKLSKEWLTRVLDVRNCSNEESKSITLTLRNILNENLESTDNLYSQIIVFKDLLNLSQSEKIKDEYRRLVNSGTNFRSHFLHLIAIRSFDIIVAEADVLGQGHNSFLRDFEQRFLKRVNACAQVLYYGLGTLVIFSAFMLNLKSSLFRETFEMIANIVGIVGFGGLTYWARKKGVNIFKNVLLSFWGYTYKKDT